MKILDGFANTLKKWVVKICNPRGYQPVDLICNSEVDAVFLRCQKDLPPVAALFWLVAENIVFTADVQMLIDQSPKDTQWWGLHSEKTIDEWMAQLPTTGPKKGKKFHKVFDLLVPTDREKTVAVSALFALNLRNGPFVTLMQARLMLAHSPAPPFVGAKNMPVDSSFLPKRSQGEPIGAWLPMFLDSASRTHDLLDIAPLSSREIPATLEFLKEFARVDPEVVEGYLARHLARFFDLCQEHQKQWEVANGEKLKRVPCHVLGFQSNVPIVQTLLLAGVCVPMGAWSSADAHGVGSAAQTRAPLVRQLASSLWFKSPLPLFEQALRRLIDQGHDVLGSDTQKETSAAELLMYFVRIGAYGAIAVMLKAGADPDIVVETWDRSLSPRRYISGDEEMQIMPETTSKMSVRECIASLNDSQMDHFLRTFKSRSVAMSILDDIDDDVQRSSTSTFSQLGFPAPSRRSVALA